ncbi:hypothetical protein [Neobacillus notoginsengisoli]|nr:hypothetical protein [Neobacillus notoginsengisoli]
MHEGIIEKDEGAFMGSLLQFIAEVKKKSGKELSWNKANKVEVEAEASQL